MAIGFVYLIFRLTLGLRGVDALACLVLAALIILVAFGSYTVYLRRTQKPVSEFGVPGGAFLLVLDVVFFGPRLWLGGFQTVSRGWNLHTIDYDGCAAVLRQPCKLPMAEDRDAVPAGRVAVQVIGHLLALDGVMYRAMTHRLNLTTEFRNELAAVARRAKAEA